jgi:hypothetical protein
MDIPKNAKIQIPIREDTEIGQFNDALYYTLDEIAAMKEADVAQVVSARVGNWVSFVKEQSSKVAPEPTKEDLEAEKVKLLEQKVRTDERLIAIDAAIAIAVDVKPIDEPIKEKP